MKKVVLFVAAIAIAIIPQSGWTQAIGQGGMMGSQPMVVPQQPAPQPNPGGFFCPNCGAYLQPGMMGYNYGMGPRMMQPGMMGYGYGTGPGMIQPGMMGYGYGTGPGIMQPGMMGYSYGTGPGMMQPGMMGYGYGTGLGMMQPGMIYPGTMGYPAQRTDPLTEKDVKTMMENQLTNFIRNPNLKLGKIREKETAFEVEIVTKDGSLVNRIFVDKRTGMMVPGN